MAIPALITIDGREMPEPSSYEAAKVSVKWNYLTAEQWAAAISPFTTKFYCSVRFLNQATNAYETRQMYVSDRTAGMWRRGPKTGKIMGWTNCALALVEV